MTSEKAFVAVEGQSFSSREDWVRRGRSRLTCHPEYHNTEHDGPAKGWRGAHFTALCFDQKGRRVRNGGDFQRAEDDGAFPVYWIWPDQIDALLRADVADAMVAEEIANRDAMEEAFSKAYSLVMGQPMEWSSAYNQAEALDDMEERLASDRTEAERKAWNAALDATLKVYDAEWRENTATKRDAIAELKREKQG